MPLCQCTSLTARPLLKESKSHAATLNGRIQEAGLGSCEEFFCGLPLPEFHHTIMHQCWSWDKPLGPILYEQMAWRSSVPALSTGEKIEAFGPLLCACILTGIFWWPSMPPGLHMWGFSGAVIPARAGLRRPASGELSLRSGRPAAARRRPGGHLRAHCSPTALDAAAQREKQLSMQLHCRLARLALMHES